MSSFFLHAARDILKKMAIDIKAGPAARSARLAPPPA